MSDDYIQNTLFFSKYKVEKRIGEGSFGKIYLGMYLYKIIFTLKPNIFKQMNDLL